MSENENFWGLRSHLGAVSKLGQHIFANDQVSTRISIGEHYTEPTPNSKVSKLVTQLPLKGDYEYDYEWQT